MAPSDDKFDASTVCLQVQQFLDEWYFRVLHAQVANDMDRYQALDIALQMFELHLNVPFPPETRRALIEMDDESKMVEQLVSLMSVEAKETFEHFALQLQLIVASTTRVRRALEHNDWDAVEISMEASDQTGITQQILKQAVTEAGHEVAELKGRQESWAKNTELRIGRLARSADDAARASHELIAIEAQLGGFGGAQSAKSKKALMGVANQNDKALCQTIFSTWFGWIVKVRGEKSIRDKFEAQIAQAEDRLIQCRQGQLANVRGVLMRKAAEGDGTLMSQVFLMWGGEIPSRKHDSESMEKMKQVEAKLAAYKQSQTENTKKVMTRMSAGSDANLTHLIWQSWNKFIVDYRNDKEMEDAVKLAEQQVKEFMKSKSGTAQGVLGRLSGSSETGLLSSVTKAWTDVVKEEKQHHQMEEMLNGKNSKFSALSSRQHGAAKGVMSRVTVLQDWHFLIRFLNAWALDSRVEGVMRHYNSKVDHKKQQLSSVQSMFHTFATQLESSISPDGERGPKRQTTNAFKDSLMPGQQAPLSDGAA